MTELRVLQKRGHKPDCFAQERDTPWCLNYRRPHITADKAGGERGHTTSWLLVRCLDPSCNALALVEEFGLWLLLNQALSAGADGRQRWALTAVPDREQRVGYQKWETEDGAVYYEYDAGQTSILMLHSSSGEAQTGTARDPGALGAALIAAGIEHREYRQWRNELRRGQL